MNTAIILARNGIQKIAPTTSQMANMSHRRMLTNAIEKNPKYGSDELSGTSLRDCARLAL